jgi:hypothetical protein
MLNGIWIPKRTDFILRCVYRCSMKNEYLNFDELEKVKIGIDRYWRSASRTFGFGYAAMTKDVAQRSR